MLTKIGEDVTPLLAAEVPVAAGWRSGHPPPELKGGIKGIMKQTNARPDGLTFGLPSPLFRRGERSL